MAGMRDNAGSALTNSFENCSGCIYVRCAGKGCDRGQARRRGDSARTTFMGESSMSNDASRFVNTRRAADYLGLSNRTLDGYRVSGAGPAFHRFGNRVRYLRSDLDAWAAKRRATTTAEADKLRAA